MSSTEKKGGDKSNGGASERGTGSNENGPSSSTENNRRERSRSTREEMDLIDLVNELQNKLVASGHTLDVNLPQIVVVGSQSAGKSSVLESFVRREFLPRGKDTVTRRPTYVQMIPCQQEYVIFEHKPDVRYTNFTEVRDEIHNETQRHPGPNKFSSDPISLKIYSPNVLKLTVVDLPGLIKCVEDGHSPDSIQEVRNMVLSYISPPEAIILAVTPAAQEIVTSDSLEIAKEVDPKRERTIGVLTKLDNLSDGTDVKDVLENHKIYLHKGYVGVINRNQQEINEGRDFDYILAKERDFFANHPAYKHLKDVSGVPYLIRMLQKTLRSQIKKFLPQVRCDIDRKLEEHRQELRNFDKRMGDYIGPGQIYNKKYYIMKLIQVFIQKVEVDLFGNSETVDIGKISHGAIINYKFATEVRRNLSLSLVPDETTTSIIIVNMLGMRTCIALPTLALDSLNKILLEQYKAPMADSVQCIKTILLSCIDDCVSVMNRYNCLKDEIIFQIRACISKEANSTTDRLKEHIEANKFFINYSHPDFDSSVCDPVAPPAGPFRLWDNASPEEDIPVEVDGASAQLNLPSLNKMKDILKQNESNQKNVKYCSTLLMKIIEQVQKQMGDIAVKYIAYFLVKKVFDYIKTELLPSVTESSNFDSLTDDCEADFCWKAETENTCKILQDALEAIRNF